MSVSVKITGDTLSFSRRIHAALESPRLRKVAAAQGAKTVRQHFRELDAKRHRGNVAFHFYAAASRATTWETSGDDAFINIAHPGIALRYFGGVVHPRKAKYLTIPVADEAQGRRVGEFGDQVEFIINRRTGKGVITLGDRVLYALTKETTHAPDKTVLPKEDDLLNDMTDAINRELDRI